MGKNGQETIDLLVQYANDSKAQRQMLAFIAENRRDKKRLFCAKRTPEAWKAVLDNYQDRKRACEKLSDFDILHHGCAVKYTDDDATFVTEPAAACAATTDKILDSIVRQLKSTTDSDVQPVLPDMLSGIQSESGVQFLLLERSGTL